MKKVSGAGKAAVAGVLLPDEDGTPRPLSWFRAREKRRILALFLKDTIDLSLGIRDGILKVGRLERAGAPPAKVTDAKEDLARHRRMFALKDSADMAGAERYRDALLADIEHRYSASQ